MRVAFDCYCSSHGLDQEATIEQAAAVMLPFSNLYCRPFDALIDVRKGNSFLQLLHGRTDFTTSRIAIFAATRDTYEETFCIPILPFSSSRQYLLTSPDSSSETVFTYHDTTKQRMLRRYLQHWGHLTISPKFEAFKGEASLVSFFEEASAPLPVKVTLLFSEQAFREAVESARAAVRYLSVQQECANKFGVTRLPIPSTLMALLLSEVAAREPLLISLTGASVPLSGEGEYEVGIMTVENATPSALIAQPKLKERVHRIHLNYDSFGLVSTSWLGDDGIPFTSNSN